MGRPLKKLGEHKNRSIHMALNHDLYEKMRDVTEIMSKEVGTKLHLTQTLEILIANWREKYQIPKED